MGLNSIFHFKDRLISERIKQELNTHLARYGDVLDVKLSTRERKVQLSIKLKGEPNPITVNIGKYELIKEDTKLWLSVDSQSIETSREWLSLVLQDQAGRQRLPIPQKYAWAVEFLG